MFDFDPSIQTATGDDFRVRSIPPLAATPDELLLPAVDSIVRDGNKPNFHYYMSVSPSLKHTLQDGVMVIHLPRGACLLVQADGVTRSRVVTSDKGTALCLNTIVELVENSPLTQSRNWPLELLRHLHCVMRDWLQMVPGAASGVAMSIALVSPEGHVYVASIGNTQVLHWRAQQPRWFQRIERLLILTTPPNRSQSPRPPSQLGQARSGPLLVETAHTHLARGDLLILGSDGGLPYTDQEDLKQTLTGYEQQKKIGLVTLCQLAQALDQRAMRIGDYDDDRSMIAIERL